MWRQVIAFVSALIAWVLVASLLNRLLRIGLPGYAAAEPAMVSLYRCCGPGWHLGRWRR
jgi:hypothetical protein